MQSKTLLQEKRLAARQFGLVVIFLAACFFGSFYLHHGADYSVRIPGPPLQGKLLPIPVVHKGLTYFWLGLKAADGKVTSLNCNTPVYKDCFPEIRSHEGLSVRVELSPKFIGTPVVRSVTAENGAHVASIQVFQGQVANERRGYLMVSAAGALLGLALFCFGLKKDEV